MFPPNSRKGENYMRKLLNKKGFSLVELMIVVVIMGILVAVAIPLYGAITENAEKKTCQSNQKLIQEMFAKYCVMEGTYSATSLLPNGTFSSKDGNTTGIDPIFVESFDGGFPECSLEGHYFVLTKISQYEIKIECYDENGNVDAKHNTANQ